jgi:hypothetical protein
MIPARGSRAAAAGQWAVVAALYAAACRVMLAPICNFGALASSTYEGDARLVAWALAWDNRAVTTGASLFDANIFHPTRAALAYGEHFFGISLFSLPVYLATRNAALAYNVVWLLSYLLAGLAVHYLTWRATRDHLASFVGGLAFAFSFFRMHHGHGHLHLVWMFWIPVSIVAMERWLATGSWLRLFFLVAVIVLQALSSWYQAVMIFVVDALLFAWLLVWTSARRHYVRLLVQAVAGAVVSLAIVSPFAWPYLGPAKAGHYDGARAGHYDGARAGRYEGAQAGRYDVSIASGGPVEAAASSADLTAFLMPPENTYLGRWMIARGVKGPRWIWGELTLFVGWITLALALAGAVVAIRGGDSSARNVQFFVLLGICAAALTMGPNAREIADNQWHWSAFGLLARIPGADLFRAPARFAALVTLALAVLAGVACASAHRRFGLPARALTVAVIPLLLLEFYVVDFPGGQPPRFPIPGIYRAIDRLPPGAVASLPDYSGTTAWYKEANYQFFSTAHWRPIVNGYSRSAPPGFAERIARLSTFPDAGAITCLREIGVRYVVVHAGDFVEGALRVEQARHQPALRLTMQSGSDYLFTVVD